MLPSYDTLDNRMTTKQRAVSYTVILVECWFRAGHSAWCGGLRPRMWHMTAQGAPTPADSWRGREPSQKQARRGAVPEVGVGHVTLSAAVMSLGCERHRRALWVIHLKSSAEIYTFGSSQGCSAEAGREV